MRRVIRPHILQVQSFSNVGAVKLKLFAKRDKTSSSVKWWKKLLSDASSSHGVPSLQGDRRGTSNSLARGKFKSLLFPSEQVSFASRSRNPSFTERLSIQNIIVLRDNRKKLSSRVKVVPECNVALSCNGRLLGSKLFTNMSQIALQRKAEGSPEGLGRRKPSEPHNICWGLGFGVWGLRA